MLDIAKILPNEKPLAVMWERVDDGGVSITHPAPGARMVTLERWDAAGNVLERIESPADRIKLEHFQGWKIVAVELQAAFIDRTCTKRLPPDARKVTIIEVKDIPVDRTFRNALQITRAGSLAHDMTRCRDIWRDRMREKRGPKLAELDVQYMRALEDGDAETCKHIKRQKDELRDITKLDEIEKAPDPTELKKVWRACLGDHPFAVKVKG